MAVEFKLFMQESIIPLFDKKAGAGQDQPFNPFSYHGDDDEDDEEDEEDNDDDGEDEDL